jgi:hypothetical protein
MLFEYKFAFVANVVCKLELEMYPVIAKLDADKFGAEIMPLAFKMVSLFILLAW